VLVGVVGSLTARDVSPQDLRGLNFTPLSFFFPYDTINAPPPHRAFSRIFSAFATPSHSTPPILLPVNAKPFPFFRPSRRCLRPFSRVSSRGDPHLFPLGGGSFSRVVHLIGLPCHFLFSPIQEFLVFLSCDWIDVDRCFPLPSWAECFITFALFFAWATSVSSFFFPLSQREQQTNHICLVRPSHFRIRLRTPHLFF